MSKSAKTLIKVKLSTSNPMAKLARGLSKKSGMAGISTQIAKRMVMSKMSNVYKSSRRKGV